MEIEETASEKSQPLLNDNDTEESCPLQCRATASQIGIRFQERMYKAAVKALHDSHLWPLLVFMPLGILGALGGWNSVLTLTFNLLAIIPLSALVSNSADLLSDHVGQLMGGLVNATFGNTVELTIGISAVIHGEIGVTQSMMIGSMLSDMVLILGVCILTATYDRRSVAFNSITTNTLCSLVTITSVTLVLPAALHAAFKNSNSSEIVKKIVAFSRGCSLILLLLYMIYLYFELRSHSGLFSDKEDSATTNDNNNNSSEDAASNPDDQEDIPMFWVAIVILLLATVIIAICAHFLLNSLDGFVKITPITKRFVATILLPIPSNASELITVISKARGNRYSFAVSVIVDSILQIALFVIPFLVILGWIIRQPMTLYFETFQSTLLFLAVLAVNRLLKDERYTYLHGIMLIQLYAVIALAVFLRPEMA